MVCKNFLGRWEQLGIVSFGWRFCSHDLIPAVYASVPQYRDWIESTTGKIKCLHYLPGISLGVHHMVCEFPPEQRGNGNDKHWLEADFLWDNTSYGRFHSMFIFCAAMECVFSLAYILRWKLFVLISKYIRSHILHIIKAFYSFI